MKLRDLFQRAKSDGIVTRKLRFEPYGHMGSVQLTYRVKVPAAGTCIGVRFPHGWPRSVTIQTLKWVGGEDVIVPSNGMVPAPSIARIRFWTKTPGILELVLGTAAAGPLQASVVFGNPKMHPHTIFVRTTENGRQTTVETWTQGTPRT